MCSIGTRTWTWSASGPRTKSGLGWPACVAVRGGGSHFDNASRNPWLKSLQLLTAPFSLLARSEIWTSHDSLRVGGNLLWRQSVNPRSTSQGDTPAGSEWYNQSALRGRSLSPQLCQSISYVVSNPVSQDIWPIVHPVLGISLQEIRKSSACTALERILLSRLSHLILTTPWQ